MAVIETIGQFHIGFDYRKNQIGLSNRNYLKNCAELWYWQELSKDSWGTVIDKFLVTVSDNRYCFPVFSADSSGSNVEHTIRQDTIREAAIRAFTKKKSSYQQLSDFIFAYHRDRMYTEICYEVIL